MTIDADNDPSAVKRYVLYNRARGVFLANDPRHPTVTSVWHADHYRTLIKALGRKRQINDPNHLFRRNHPVVMEGEFSVYEMHATLRRVLDTPVVGHKTEEEVSFE